MSDFIVDNDFIMASVQFDDDLGIEWEGKTSNTDKIITSLVLEIKKLKEIQCPLYHEPVKYCEENKVHQKQLNRSK